MCKKEELRAVTGGMLPSSNGEETEFHATVHFGKEAPAVLEVEQANEAVGLHHVPEKELRCIVGGDPALKHATGPAVVVHETPDYFGEDGVEVDVATAAEWVSPAVPQESTVAVGVSEGGSEAPVQRGIFRGQRPDLLLALCGVGGVGDRAVAASEELLLLELDTLPGRITEHYVEPAGICAAVVEHLGELQRPVEEPVLIGERDGCVERGRYGVATGKMVRKRGGRDGGFVRSKRLKERRRPEVAREILALTGRVLMPVLEQRPLAADRLRRIVGDRIDLERDIGESGQGFRRVPGQTVLAVVAFGAVLPLQKARHLGVVIREGDECGVRNAVGEHVEVEHAD